MSAPESRAPALQPSHAGRRWGTIALALLALMLGMLGWHVWWNLSGRSQPWTEEPAHPSPDGRHVVYREGRSAFMELETRVTIAPVDAPAGGGGDATCWCRGARCGRHASSGAARTSS